MTKSAIVYIIDDDIDVRSALQLLMESVGLQVQTYVCGTDYLGQFDFNQAGCLIVDVRMPGISGLDLQAQLAAEKHHPPIIIITGHGDVPMAVKAVKAGAVDFIEKPFNNQNMLDSVHRAIALDAKQRGDVSHKLEISERFESLTPREKEVFTRVVAGQRNKVIAAELFITQSTIEVHRARVMEKMLAKSLSDLMRMALVLEII
ncbi:MAG: response regulator [Pseudomonadota bacterium]